MATIQGVYLALFGRPADPTGLTYFNSVTKNGADLSAIGNLAGTAEYQTRFTGQSNIQIINSIYQSLFGRDADVAGLTFWANGLASGKFTINNIAISILDGAQGSDLTIVNNKIAAANLYTTSLDTTAEIVAYNGTAAADAGRAFISGVTTTVPAQSAVDAAILTMQNTPGGGLNLAFTTGIDQLVGGSGNDVFNATVTSTSAVLGGLDSVDGGAGKDTLNIADTAVATNAAFALPTGFSVKNVETVNVTTNGALGDGTTTFDVTGATGITTLNGTAAGASGGAAANVKAAGTTAVNLTVAGTGTVTVNGGSAVSVKGAGGTVTINDAAGTNTGTTLTAVTLNSVDANTNVKGGGIASVTVGGATTAARTITIDNAAASHALNIVAAGTGYKADGKTEVQTVVTDTVATSATVNSTAKSSLDISNSTAVKSVTITGSGDLKLATATATTTIDGSAATGAINLGDLGTAATSVKTGSGNDALGVTATTKFAVDTGAGDDVVTLKSAVAAASTITLGAGSDKVLYGAGGSVAVSTSTVIDGGDGTDTVSARLITAGNASQFKNFEVVNLDSTTGFDLSLVTGVTGLSISSASASATYTNVTQSQGLTIDFVGDNSAVTNTLSLTGVSGTADTYAIKFNAAATTTAATSADVKAGTVVTDGIENITIDSSGTGHWNSITLGADASAKTVVVTGASNLDLTFASGFGSTTSPQTGVSSIDGSAATGKLNIDLTNVVGATGGISVKGGSGADTLKAGTTTVTLTGGAGSDTFDVSQAVGGASKAVVSTIADIASGEKIVFAAGTAEAFTSAKVDVSAATSLSAALDLASTANGTTGTTVKWFQYAGNTYVVEDLGAGATFAATDIAVKVTGLVDLSTASYNTGTHVLTLA